jgi:hypothetical protein
VICGDLPTDYVSAQSIWHPRDAVREIAQRWLSVVPYLRRGERHPTIRVGPPGTSADLAPLLESRAKLLLKWVENKDIWPE